MAFIGHDKGVNYKLITSFHFNEDQNIKVSSGNSIEDVLQQVNSYSKNELNQSNKDCHNVNNLYITNLFYKDNKTSSEYYGFFYDKLKDLVEKEYKFSLFSGSIESEGKCLEDINEIRKNWFIIGTYDINGVVLCSTKNNDYLSPSERKEYIKNGYAPYLSTNCTWGENFGNSNNNNSSINNDIKK